MFNSAKLFLTFQAYSFIMKNSANFTPKDDDVFGRIASRYDRLCDFFSLGIHRLWKRRVAQIIGNAPWNNLLDVASGTGDIVYRILQQRLLNSEIDSSHQIIVSDISLQMLHKAKQKVMGHSANMIFMQLDAENMIQVKSASQDVVAISLGLKICDRHKALQEAYRVLKTDGRLVVLEASNIPINWIQRLYLAYMSAVMPIIGWLATSGDSSAYQYLLKGLKDFPSAENLAQEIADIGFGEVSFERLSFGIVAIHTAHKF